MSIDPSPPPQPVRNRLAGAALAGLLVGAVLVAQPYAVPGVSLAIPGLVADDTYLNAGPSHPAHRAFDDPARLYLIYWPAAGNCTPQEARIIPAIHDFIAGHADIVATSIVPEGQQDDRRYGLKLPGEVIRLPPRAYAKYLSLAPTPRLEVWNLERQPLLLRFLPSYGNPSDTLTEDLVALLAGTTPVDETI